MAGENDNIAFHQRELSVNDFDGTIANTSEPAPNGMTVALAYEEAVEKVLGQQCLDAYRQGGGLRNRAPSEVVTELAPDLDTIQLGQKTEDLVEAKLAVLSNQVGQKLPDGSLWPRPMEGFVAFWTQVSEQPAVDTAILSSGHETFIKRFYEVHELALPDLRLTDDDMRPLMEHLPPELCVKPGRLLMDMVHTKWLESHDIEAIYENFETSRSRITYAGDDPVKDGNLAKNAGVEFIYINPQNPAIGWSGLSKLLFTLEAVRA